MKTTAKQFTENSATKNKLTRLKNQANNDNDMETYFECKELLEELEHTYFRHLPTVNISFYIGYRSYYQSVVKIGKGYYLHGQKMTQGRGYRSIEEIPAITDNMKESMLADSYYY